MDETRPKPSSALSQIEKQFGKGSTTHGRRQHRARISRPFHRLARTKHRAQGLAVCRAVGSKSTAPNPPGKTTLPQVIAEMQKPAALGVSSTPSTRSTSATRPPRRRDRGSADLAARTTGEQALEIADMLVRSGRWITVVIDSVAALTPAPRLERSDGRPARPADQARLMSQALRKLTANIKRKTPGGVFINQIRMKIGVINRLPGDHHRRQRAPVLRLGAHGHPPTGTIKKGGRGGRFRRPASGVVGKSASRHRSRKLTS